ncbi:pyridoxamine 5'-phosphate oxidase [archaeon BMS3Abin17]|nr:pyridoxamine 5'-phosphate oxidase [archaeon BMS3Abin17]HDZ60272.1 pyridoxamine 5'-phosphate oxidase family protein [Candidatus Pacearchaeota archaeon]
MEINEEVKKMIEENPVALATIKDGNPYVITVAFVKVKDDKIVITNNYMTNTINNIKDNPNVSLAVWNKDWKGYQINGKAEYFEEGEWHDFVKAIEENKDEACRGAIVVEVNKIKRLA